ncbi:TPA: hypothetical protein ACPZRZ_002637 [Yersinia enterocolitica]|uniref:hypothetical protein n=1 Tax=Yersinia enterocolitica TaxID=630 RepID=UPI0028B3A629|nr:hypothetical protein [Yersinia enterocolitica]ELI7993215.1 hypothetical protein [Yersinia enterocolitica]ELI8051619.1 hypothetical protein [Yersinia enterocolitica]ELW7357714.1 hypothetical protein [Yersinia enterocolitica]ELX2284353.1 hypothetical protein [Yersinia enterocolitica]
MKIEIIIAIIGTIISVIAIIASYFSGVRAGKVNEKRKEWNAVAEPVIEYLEGHLSSLNRKRCPPDNNLNKFPRKSWDSALRRSTKTKAEELERLLADYRSVLDEVDKHPAIVSAEKLIDLLSLR